MVETANQYETIFISHALPEDNEFVTWLTARLSLLGYKVWCEIVEQKGGEDFWVDIERIIRNEAIKFLAVTSKSSISPLKRGVRKELALASQITNRGNFIVPLRIDDVPYNQFPAETSRLNTIDFSENWGTGLKQLVELLVKDRVTLKSDTEPKIWDAVLQPQNDVLKRRDERYWTNWIQFTLPKKVYIHLPFGANNFSTSELPYPTVSRANYLISFACSECIGVKVRESQIVAIEDFLKRRVFQSDGLNLTIQETNKLIIDLANQTFSRLLLESGLMMYSLSRDNVYFFPTENGNHIKVDLKAYSYRYIQLTGKSKEHTWHYALKAFASLFPNRQFEISHHLVFTNNQKFLDVKQQHSLGRKRRKTWYNKQWRNLLLAALLQISKSPPNSIMKVSVCCKQEFEINNTPIAVMSSMGYEEPQ